MVSTKGRTTAGRKPLILRPSHVGNILACVDQNTLLSIVLVPSKTNTGTEKLDLLLSDGLSTSQFYTNVGKHCKLQNAP